MRQWEIYKFPHPSADDPHFCVVISPDGIADNPGYKTINVLPCQTLYAGRELKPNEVALDEADGMDRLTVVKCHMVETFPKESATERRGPVTPVRVAQIRTKLAKLFGLPIH